MSIETQIQEIFKKVLDIKPQEIRPDEKLDASLGIDSTELVEISVGIKKDLNVPLADGELKKTHTFNELVAIVKARQAAA